MSVAVVVTKSSPELVVPSESETTAAPVMAADDTIALSSFDLCILPFPMKLLLAFDRPIHEPVETIKRALAHYRPAAGRLDGRGGIACTGEGVAFVAALAGCALDEAAVAVGEVLVVSVSIVCRVCVLMDQ